MVVLITLVVNTVTDGKNSNIMFKILNRFSVTMNIVNGKRYVVFYIKKMKLQNKFYSTSIFIP